MSLTQSQTDRLYQITFVSPVFLLQSRLGVFANCGRVNTTTSLRMFTYYVTVGSTHYRTLSFTVRLTYIHDNWPDGFLASLHVACPSTGSRPPAALALSR